MTTPYRTVFVPLDGSSFAEQALPLAAELAVRSNAILQLALVHHPVPALATAVEAPELEAQLDDETRLRERQYLNGVVHRLQTGYNIPVTGITLDGPVVDALQSQILASGVDLVVSTTHGRGPVSRFWLGSVADQLIRRLHVPLLLVRPGAPDRLPPASFSRILIALDGSPFAERALAEATALGRAFGASYDLVSVVEPPAPIADPSGLMVIPVGPDTYLLQRKQAGDYLEKVAKGLRDQGLEVTCHPVDGGAVATCVLAQAEAGHSDLIALASHGAGGLERLVVGSVADKVIRGTIKPVLVVRPMPD
jgi:nucleotide-binding universal stress UspA family protein